MQEPSFETRLQEFRRCFQALSANLSSAVVGQDALIKQTLIGLLAGGHLLFEGVPGLGKTQLAKSLAASLGVKLGRIQCVPDLMPADITGGEILVSRDGAHSALEFRAGPVFSSLLLVDEINRATPKTQAALLEAMQEGHVTFAGHSHPLPRPFWMIATQNPIEFEGTYPLPEAQLDRFLFKLDVGYPDAATLSRLLDVSLDHAPDEQLKAVASLADIQNLASLAKDVLIAPALKDAAISLILSTHPEHTDTHPVAKLHFRYGASPRGLQALVRTARVHALTEGRAHVALDDLHAVALPALRHRVLLSLRSETQGVRPDTLLNSIIDDWRTRHV